MAKNNNSKLAKSLEKARRSGGNIDSVLGINNPNSSVELKIQRSTKLSALLKDMRVLGPVQEDWS